MSLREKDSPEGERVDIEIILRTDKETGRIEMIVEYYSVDPFFHEDRHRAVVDEIKDQLGLQDVEVKWERVGQHEQVLDDTGRKKEPERRRAKRRVGEGDNRAAG